MNFSLSWTQSLGSYWNSNGCANIPKTVRKVENRLKAEVLSHVPTMVCFLEFNFFVGSFGAMGFVVSLYGDGTINH